MCLCLQLCVAGRVHVCVLCVSGTSNLRKELTFSRTVVFSTAVFTALHSGVMCDVCMKTTRCMYTPNVVFVHTETVCFPITKHIITLCTKRMETSIKCFKQKPVQVGLVKKVLKQED